MSELLPSLMKNTQNEPIIREIPAIIIIRYSGASWSGVLSSVRIHPPTKAAMICGMQMVQLNSPKYAPILPECNELVRMVKGHASIAAHAHPISRNEMNSSHGLVMNAVSMNPNPPSISDRV